MKKDSRIRVGDKVRLISEARVIERVGYDNNLLSISEELDRGVIRKFLLSLNQTSPGKDPYSREITAVAKAAAYYLVRTRIKEGVERKIYYDSQTPLNFQCPGTIFHVDEIKIVKTGMYFSPTYDYDGGVTYLDCPGGLNNPVTHKLIKICGYLVEAKHFEKVME